MAVARAVKQTPWWWEEAAPTDAFATELPAQTDVLVVGSGYAGLCCALELARAGTDVTVVDARKIGEGASSRAAGFTSGRAGVSKQIDLEAAVGPERAAAILNEADEAYDHLQDVIDTEAIDCDFQPVGRYVGAHTHKAYGALARKMAEYNSDGMNQFEMVPPAGQGGYIETDLYFGGMLIKNAGSIHPSKYHAGLVRLCRDAGVRFVANTHVDGTVPEAGRFRVITAAGDVVAREVALGTGGYTDSASPWHQRRVVPISSTIIATGPLGRDVVDRLLPAGCPVIDTKRVLYFARPTPDRERILFGGRASFLRVGLDRKLTILRRQLSEMFPELADVPVTHVWDGQMAFTFDFLPKLGIQDGVHYAMACNGGSGIVMMSWLGRKMAGQILGTANRKSAFHGLPFRTHPFYAGKPWFLPVIGNWYRLRDWMDLRENRRAE